jgi:sterol desaturase/sphingolipid hydroxylase (fatty acid hydroxylase superfamily)
MFEMSEATTRLAVFGGLFAIMALSEYFVPRRQLKPVKVKRWFTNWSIVVMDSVIVRLLFNTAAVGGALWAADQNIGLFNLVNVPYFIAFAVSFVVLDFAVWLSHLASHKIPVFWRIHRMHHSDIDIDVSTAIRFHPIEIVLSMIWKFGVVLLLGAPAAAVLVFEIVLNGGAMFNHANFKLPLAIDRILRLFIVTPDMHRVHHSTDHRETDSNYGFNFSFWDRLFGTYIDQPALGHENMTIGISQWQNTKPTELLWSLKVPFADQFRKPE